jgi:hypothetical protein
MWAPMCARPSNTPGQDAVSALGRSDYGSEGWGFESLRARKTAEGRSDRGAPQPFVRLEDREAAPRGGDPSGIGPPATRLGAVREDRDVEQRCEAFGLGGLEALAHLGRLPHRPALPRGRSSRAPSLVRQ